MRKEDLAASPSCNIFTRGLIWEPLPVVKEPAEAVVVIDSSDEEDEDPIPKKRTKKDGTCVICFEEENSKDDPLLEANCCRQLGHLSCLRRFYEMPAECKTVNERKEIALKVGVPRCFVCRVDSSDNVVGLHEILPTLLPKVTGRKSVMRAFDANQALTAWYAMFWKYIMTLTKHCKHWKRFDSGTGWAMRRDGKIEMFEFTCPTQAMRISAFRYEFVEAIKKIIRVWAGLPTRVAFTSNSYSQFCLDDIVEVALTLRLSQTCTLRRQPVGQDVPPFQTESYLARLCILQCTGHFFDFDDITVTFNSKFFSWDHKFLPFGHDRQIRREI